MNFFQKRRFKIWTLPFLLLLISPLASFAEHSNAYETYSQQLENLTESNHLSISEKVTAYLNLYAEIWDTQFVFEHGEKFELLSNLNLYFSYQFNFIPLAPTDGVLYHPSLSLEDKIRLRKNVQEYFGAFFEFLNARTRYRFNQGLRFKGKTLGPYSIGSRSDEEILRTWKWATSQDGVLAWMGEIIDQIQKSSVVDIHLSTMRSVNGLKLASVFVTLGSLAFQGTPDSPTLFLVGMAGVAALLGIKLASNLRNSPAGILNTEYSTFTKKIRASWKSAFRISPCLELLSR